MLDTFTRLQARLSAAQWLALTILAVAFNLWATQALNAAYAASAFPVPYWEAQLSFDHQRLKGWYQALIDGQTLSLYWHAQAVDFLFIASVLVLHPAALVLVSRLHAATSKGRQVLLAAALLSALAPLFYALENGVSFGMLANPLGFDPFLAVVYSTLAAAKFGLFTFAYVAAPLGVLWALYAKLVRRSARLPSAAAAD